MRNIAGYNIEENDVTWVITVPAIWRDSAKQFMREAANMVVSRTIYNPISLASVFADTFIHVKKEMLTARFALNGVT